MKKHLKRSWGRSSRPTNLQIKQIKGGEKVDGAAAEGKGKGSRWQGQRARHNTVSAKSVANE